MRLRTARVAALTLVVSASCTEPPRVEPAPDVFVASLTVGDSISIGIPQNISHHSGYDNQPSFTPDGTQLLYTCEQEGQTDIYRYRFDTGVTEAVTNTPESEYSATPMPGGRAFSSIRVELDSVQRLWAFDMTGDRPRVVLPNVAPVGYHAWIDSITVALFVLGSPPTLQLTSIGSEAPTIEAENIGRSLHRIPDKHALSYVRKISDTEWWIVAFDLITNRHTRLIETLPGREDFAWTPDGTLLMADGTSLYQWKAGQHDDWALIADLSSHGLGPITRLAVSPQGDRIALVSDVP